MITIYDIAKRTGFNPATVSRALNNSDKVKFETKVIIQTAAVEMGYIPNTVAQNLKAQKSWNIGIIWNFSDTMGLNHYFFANILENFHNVAATNGYDITMLSKKHILKTDYLRYIRSKKFDGIFLICGNFDEPAIIELLYSDVPVVGVDYMGQNINSMDTAYVTSNNKEIMKEFVTIITKRGHRDILFVTGSDVYVTQERIAGFKEGLRNIPFRSEMLIRGMYYSMNATKAIVKEILARKTLPSVIIFPDDYCAIVAIKSLAQANVRVPEDVSVCGFDGLEIGTLLSPTLATVVQDTKAIGEVAATKLLGLINKQGGEGVQIIPASIRLGESLK